MFYRDLKAILIIGVFLLGSYLAFFLILSLIFRSKPLKEEMRNYLEFVKGLPFLVVFYVLWAAFWGIPIMSVWCIIDVLFLHSIFHKVGIFSNLLALSLSLIVLWLWYLFGWTKLNSKKAKDKLEIK